MLMPTSQGSDARACRPVRVSAGALPARARETHDVAVQDLEHTRVIPHRAGQVQMPALGFPVDADKFFVGVWW
jgi:hypothetical protein